MSSGRVTPCWDPGEPGQGSHCPRCQAVQDPGTGWARFSHLMSTWLHRAHTNTVSL